MIAVTTQLLDGEEAHCSHPRRWLLAGCGVILAARANSVAVSARPVISACSMQARAVSPDRKAISANSS